MAEPIWCPSPARVQASRLTAFRERAERRSGRSLGDYSALHRWSIEHQDAFWGEIWSFCEVIGERGRGRAFIGGESMREARWFPGARLNFAENLLRRGDEAPALISRVEGGARRELSFGELRRCVSRLASALRASGVSPGDRVAAVLPNSLEAVVAMLATTSLGAIWSSCSPDFGVRGVVDRFGQIEPVILFAVDSYAYGGVVHPCSERLPAILEQLPSIRRTVVVPGAEPLSNLGDIANAVSFEEFCNSGSHEQMDFARFPFEHPLAILYSSGTTGKPKSIVHSAGGTLLQHLKEHRLHVDLGETDRLFYFTTCGWMMWNWLVSGLASGATLVLYDGSPAYPDPGVLFELAEREQITIFGTSAKFLDAAAKGGVEPRTSYDLSELRTILSTGSPLLPEGFDFVYDHVARDVHLASISGGTDIISCFVLGDPTAPVYRGEIQVAGLGMAVDVFDQMGESAFDREGELVCTRAFPSMPLKFWNDDTGDRYRAAYFDRFSDVWSHGDWTRRTEHGFVISGRSDAVLNPGGVRIGTAEIYRPVERIDEVLEALAVAQQWRGDVRIALFVKLREGRVLDTDLIDRIRREIRESASPRHVPAVVVAVPDLPRTRSGKISELAVREVVHGRTVRNLEALANPEALEYFRELPELGV